MMNYLARRRSPIPTYGNYTPFHIDLYTERLLVAHLERSPPDFAILIDRQSRVYGKTYFGGDYGIAIHRWILASYSVVWKTGSVPLTGAGFGIVIMRRKGR